MAGTPEYQTLGEASPSAWAQGRILSNTVDWVKDNPLTRGYNSVEQKLKELLGSQDPASTPAQPMAEPQASPTPQALTDQQRSELYPEGESEWIRQYLSRTPTPGPTATPTTSESLMGMLGLGAKR